MTGREILEEVVALLGQVPEGDEAQELCLKLREWLSLRLGAGTWLHSWPSRSRPAFFLLRPPHCLKKNGTLASVH